MRLLGDMRWIGTRDGAFDLSAIRAAASLRSSVRTSLLMTFAVLVVCVGQYGRELLPPDDLREAEVAREMWQGRDYVVPHLAGRPFVEKPPGFSAVVALAYGLVGAPSAAAARTVVVVFALATLAAVFLCARMALG